MQRMVEGPFELVSDHTGAIALEHSIVIDPNMTLEELRVAHPDFTFTTKRVYKKHSKEAEKLRQLRKKHQKKRRKENRKKRYHD